MSNPQVSPVTALAIHREGCVHLHDRRVRLAVAKFEEALRRGLDPSFGLHERWTAWMLLGHFERAWQETDRIECQRRRGVPVEGQLIWNGADFEEKAVLLRSLHGLGDALQFIRYARLLKTRCRRLTFKGKPILLPLMQTLGPIDEAIPLSAPDPRFDVEMECTELPYVFRTTLHTIPYDMPYIRVSGRDGLPCAEGRAMRVGLVWTAGSWNKARSLALADLSPLRTVPNVTFYSLQWGADWIAAQRAHHGLPIHNVTRPIPEDLLYTAHTIAHLDLVITVDTMVAHLAGAMGKPVWILLPYDCDWRWLTGTETSPWYPTVTLFRQVLRGDWSHPVSRVTEALQRHSLVTVTT
jgi:hypothetical protein